MDICACGAAIYLSVTVGPNDENCHICDGIYSSMGQVSKEYLTEDREAECCAS